MTPIIQIITAKVAVICGMAVLGSISISIPELEI